MIKNPFKKSPSTPTIYGGEYFISIAPNEKIIAMRAACLGALLIRNEYEMSLQNPSDDFESLIPTHDDKVLELLHAWCQTEGITNYFSKNELRLYKKELGSWNKQQIIDVSWRSQALGTILWSLSIYDKMLAYDDGFRLQENLFNRLGVLLPLKEFKKRIKLRTIEEIRFERDVAEHWHWRVRTNEAMKKDIKLPNNMTWEAIIKQSAYTGYEDGTNPKPIKNDFPVNGKAFKDLSEDEYQTISSSVSERHFALNWLCGYSKKWDDTPTDT